MDIFYYHKKKSICTARSKHKYYLFFHYLRELAAKSKAVSKRNRFWKDLTNKYGYNMSVLNNI